MASTLIAKEYAAIPRAYKRQGILTPEDMLELFTHRLLEYDAGVTRCSLGEIPEEISRLLKSRNRKRLAIPDGLPAAWLPQGFDFPVATNFDVYQLDALDGVLTGCTVLPSRRPAPSFCRTQQHRARASSRWFPTITCASFSLSKSSRPSPSRLPDSMQPRPFLRLYSLGRQRPRTTR